jgi:hypothetical protein
METNEHLQRAISEVLDNQLQSGEPPETKQTLARLLKSGLDGKETRRLICCVISGEIFDIMKNNKPFNRERFVTRLAELPDTSWLDE